MIAGTKYPLGVVYLRQVVVNSLALPVVVLFSNAFNNTSTQDAFKQNKLISPLDFAKILFDNVLKRGKNSNGSINNPPSSIRLASGFLLLAFAPLAVISAVVAIAFSIVAMPFYLATMILTAPLSLKIHSAQRDFVARMAVLLVTNNLRNMSPRSFENDLGTQETPDAIAGAQERFPELDAKKESLIRMNRIHDMLCTIIVNALIVGTTAVAAHFFGTMILSKGLSLLASAGIVQSDTNILSNLPGGAGLAAHICFTLPLLAISLCAIVAGLFNIRSHYKMLECGTCCGDRNVISANDIIKKAMKVENHSWQLQEGDLYETKARDIAKALNDSDPGTATLGIVEYPGGMDSASLFRHSSHVFRGAELLINLPMSVPVSLCNAVLSCCNNRALQAGD